MVRQARPLPFRRGADALGAGSSAKPSDALTARFPRYNCDDRVLAQHRPVTEGLGLKHLQLVIGNSMGGMRTWLWGVTYPGLADVLVPMASQPTEMAGRNWLPSTNWPLTPELGIMERELAKVRGAKPLLIPAGSETRGQGTTGFAKFYKQALAELLQTAPRLAFSP